CTTEIPYYYGSDFYAPFDYW
nr:immunoglobulin heavy chain junction region [Macaca mulatta]MOW98865.1 immunoglobulin heavy chain junction region [Macaca mulatta]MOW99416.1 immunoglobulin heavy chain junction region [Macaca mulatta]MOW99772.1 immunoglobulin heavy chain junction region [Macaca mulatta]MOX01577.1 immunoglobulin heavy chain junction region [Macaca mulatta]